jgi:hypothetical protein
MAQEKIGDRRYVPPVAAIDYGDSALFALHKRTVADEFMQCHRNCRNCVRAQSFGALLDGSEAPRQSGVIGVERA